ncbi:MAG TPA: MDR family MFS transporter [Roseiflexaceae bacterium]|nr:MDR family MFS transporter [Roseiflexaceae bacterium]
MATHSIESEAGRQAVEDGAATAPPVAQAATQAHGEGLYGSQALVAMLGIAMVVLLAALDQTIVGTALPSVIAELQGFDLYAWVATSYLLTSTIMVPIMGKIGDLYGRKPFLLAAIVIFVAASAAAGAANSMLFLIIARAVQGIGAGMLQATAFASVGDMFPQPERRARWQGIITGTFGLASVVGPSLGGIMTDTMGWRSVFYVNLPIGLLAILMIWQTLPANLAPRVPNARIDWAGAATITLSISALLLAVEWGGRAYAWGSPQILSLLTVGLVALAGFLLVERRAPEPLMPLDLFRNRTVALCAGISLLVGFSLFALVFYTPLLAQGVLGLTPSAAGAVMTPLVACMAVGSLLSGQIFARLGRARPLMLTGTALVIVSTFLLTRITPTINHVVLGVQMGMCGVGMGMLMPMMTVLVQSAVERRRLGVSTAMVQFVRLIGSTMGTAVVGALVSGIYAAQILAQAPQGTDVRMLSFFHDPQALISPQTQEQVHSLAQQLPGGAAQLQQLLDIGREALAGGIRSGYFLALGAMILAAVLVALLDDRSLAKAHTPKEDLDNSDSMHAL